MIKPLVDEIKKALDQMAQADENKDRIIEELANMLSEMLGLMAKYGNMPSDAQEKVDTLLKRLGAYREV